MALPTDITQKIPIRNAFLSMVIITQLLLTDLFDV
jgi:hypothetical protein